MITMSSSLLTRTILPTKCLGPDSFTRTLSNTLDMSESDWNQIDRILNAYKPEANGANEHQESDS